jgi:hypothetical protein
MADEHPLPASPVPLGYARRPSSRRKSVRRVTAALLLAAIVAGGCRWGAAVVDRAATLYWQRRCMNYEPEQTRVVFDNDTARAAALLASGRYRPAVRAAAPGTTARQLTAAAGDVPCWVALCRRVGLAPPATRSSGTAFCHRVISPAGNERVVSVEVREISSGTSPDLALQVTVIVPGSWRKPPLVASGPGHYVSVDATPPTRVFAGQRDPADASKFSILIEHPNGRLRFRGQLNDDDTVGFGVGSE